MSAHPRLDLAVEQARLAREAGNHPFGAVLADADGMVVLSAQNTVVTDSDVTGHAESNLVRLASQTLGRDLRGYSLYTSTEPCAMCAGAMVLARLDALVFGADDPKAGFAGSLGDLTSDPRLNHRLHLVRGVRAEEAAALLRTFFVERRGLGAGSEEASSP